MENQLDREIAAPAYWCHVGRTAKLPPGAVARALGSGDDVGRGLRALVHFLFFFSFFFTALHLQVRTNSVAFFPLFGYIG